MYNIEDIKVLHLEITSKCQASCPMCARNIQGGIQNPFLKNHEIDYDTFVKWFSKDFISQLNKIYLCGNYGDPIVAKDTLKIFEYIRQNNLTCDLSMNTNGSAKDQSFWSSLAALNVTVRFGIDGLEDTHKKYRIGTDWNKIINNAKTFISAGGIAIWDMLVFKHNENQVEECKKLSNDLGFVQFVPKHTSRFKETSLTVLDNKGFKIDELFPTERSLDYKDKIVSHSKKIDCKALEEKSLYVSANGNVTPCCWTDLEFSPHHNPSRVDIYFRIGPSPNLHINSLSDIFNLDYFSKIKNFWKCDPLRECSKQCGTFKKFEAQYEG
jgi:MoaA/NifB/PqqE/SkfB family radical SAM enzyme